MSISADTTIPAGGSPPSAAAAVKRKLRLGAVGDLHCNKDNGESIRSLFAHVSTAADVLLLCGDLVDHGSVDEARILGKEIAVAVRIPVIAVLGNHDFEAGQQRDIITVLQDVGVHVLDGEACEIEGVGFAGVKGFAGGFGAHALGAWGEEAIKSFVHEAVNEALKLEAALARLGGGSRVVVMHYSPIAATVQGEAVEIYPFLGSSRLEDPINRYPVAAVFHGHAHAGSTEGRTSAGIPVYNVAAPLLRREFPDRPPFRVIEVTSDSPVTADAEAH
jgi:Icc-related predicted phosphoesterase